MLNSADGWAAVASEPLFHVEVMFSLLISVLSLIAVANTVYAYW